MKNDRFPNQAFKYQQKGKKIWEDLEATGNCKMPEHDLTDLIHDAKEE
jgi:hypothetical protein